VTLGFQPAGGTQDAFASHLTAEAEKWRKVVREANIKIE
jgi:tripartite-type tricarboxylate transporter receptor subunit TctC